MEPALRKLSSRKGCKYIKAIMASALKETESQGERTGEAEQLESINESLYLPWEGEGRPPPHFTAGSLPHASQVTRTNSLKLCPLSLYSDHPECLVLLYTYCILLLVLQLLNAHSWQDSPAHQTRAHSFLIGKKRLGFMQLPTFLYAQGHGLKNQFWSQMDSNPAASTYQPGAQDKLCQFSGLSFPSFGHVR